MGNAISESIAIDRSNNVERAGGDRNSLVYARTAVTDELIRYVATLPDYLVKFHR